jgi:DNA-binding NarL/FixJ family response regulator
MMTLALPTRPADSLALTVLVVDDHKSFAQLLGGALEASGMTLVGVADSGSQAVSMAEAFKPDLVVIDIEMPRQDGLAATRLIRTVSPETAVAVVTAHRDPDWVTRAAQAGASAFIPKNGSLDEMIDVLSRVRPGQMLVSPSVFSRDGTGSRTRRASDGPVLTRREAEILSCLGQGMQVKAIARVLDITVHTCRGYVKSLHAKLGARSQLEAVLRGQQLGLLDPGDSR